MLSKGENKFMVRVFLEVRDIGEVISHNRSLGVCIRYVVYRFWQLLPSESLLRISVLENLQIFS